MVQRVAEGPTAIWRARRDATLERFGHAVGASVDSVSTPALLVDRAALDANIRAMARHVERAGVLLRPHAKVHKSPDLARRQIEAGAAGVSVASVWEAAAMVAAGVPRVLIANQVVGDAKIAALAELSATGAVEVVVDDPANVRALDEAVSAVGVRLDVLIEVDVGMRRCGTRSEAEAVDLAHQVLASRSLRLRGIQAYEGHCMLEPDRAARVRLATEAMELAGDLSAAIRDVEPSAVTVSGGGTGTYDISAGTPALTELQAGSYVFMDAFHRGLVSGFDFSLFVASTVVSRHGATTVLDAGRKSIGIDFVSPPMVGVNVDATYYAEEHAIFELPDHPQLHAGSRVRLLPGYAPTTVNLYDALFLVGPNGTVEDVWPVFPRGPLPI